jgi:filamentous hemagglutinin family protein
MWACTAYSQFSYIPELPLEALAVTKFSLLSRGWQLKLVGSVAIVGTLFIAVGESVLAQIVPDNTLGAESSVITPNVNIQGIQGDRIDGGATRGANLFHSFSEFNVGEGRGVYFANPDGIENILSRVTGGNASQILGRLGVLGDANLFLLNPNGILFGENASLDIQGSFVASTASGIELGEDGYFSATQPQSSRLLAVSPGALFYNAVAATGGKITNLGNLKAGEDLTLSAGNLDLQGQLRSGRDLTLQAQDTVKVRDSVATPFLAQAGGNLTIQGNGGIDIWALNHPMQTPFVSGGNLSLISDGIISGDARFASGGSFLIQSVSGGLANFVSKNDPIISASGDVNVAANYTGASLLVEAQGNIRFGGNITITTPDTSMLPAGPDTETLRTSTALIMRSGQDTLAYGGVNSGSVPYSTGSVPEGITIGGDVILQPSNGVGGIVDLKAASGDVNTQLISTNGQRTFNLDNDAQGGAISIAANGSINTGGLNSYSLSPSGNAGNGGEINLLAANGINITDKVKSYSYAPNGSAGDGGAIKLSATNDITTDSLDSDSWSNLGTGGNGGAISINTTNGSINTDYLHSYSYSGSGSAGNGGTIRLQAGNDLTIKGNVYSYSDSNDGNAGDGGAIHLEAANGINVRGILDSYSHSDYGNTANGGLIRLLATNGDITTNGFNSSSNAEEGLAGNGSEISLKAPNGNISTKFLSSYSNSLSAGTGGNGGTINLEAGNSINIDSARSFSSNREGQTGNGGTINLKASEDINIAQRLESYSRSGFGIGRNGGTITLSSDSGDIIFFNPEIITTNTWLYSFSYSEFGNTGNGGEISISARGGDIRAFSKSLLASFALSEAGTAGSGGNVTVAAQNNIRNLEILTLSSFDEAGDVALNGFGDLSVTNTRILTSRRVDVEFSDKFITLEVGGQGQSGDVYFTSLGNLTFNNSSIESDTNGSDKAGNVTLSSPGLVTFNNSFIRSNTSSKGAAGSIGIEAGQGISLIGSGSGLSAGTTNQGEAGDITLTTPELILQNGANIATTTASSSAAGNITLQSHPNGENLNINLAPGTSISASTSNQGIGGNIEIKAPDSVTIQGQGTITTSTTGTGNAGNITLDTSTLTIARGAQLFAFTEGSGNSGKIEVNASTAVNLGIGVDDFSPVLSVETSNAGKAGNITINTPSLRLSDTARITATATSTATNRQGGGSITLNASTMDLAGVVGVFAETQGQSPAGTLTLKPYQNQSTLNLTLAPQSLVSASTTGSGKGGNLIVEAPEAITIQGPGELAVQTTGDGAAGDLRIDTQRLTIADGATISASTSSSNPAGIGGNITINATESFNLTNQARLLAQSTGAGRAGDVTINTPQLNLDQAQVSVETSGAGAAGDVEITTETLTLERGAKVSATATATATTNEPGGSVNVNASQINLSGNTSGLFAQTQGAASAGSLTLKPFNNGQTLSVNLQDNPQISASTSDSGEGGSLRVTAPEAVTIRGLGQLSVETTGAGKAGGLTIETQKLNISDGATVSASTSSPYASGTGGNLTINATQSFNLTNQASLLAQSNGAAAAGDVKINTPQLNLLDEAQVSVETSGAGVAGDVEITTETLTLDRGAKVSATAANTATTSAQGGNVNVNASQINLSGNTSGLFAQTQGAAPAGSLILQPYSNGQTLRVNLEDNPQVSASTSGSGKGGNLSVTAPEAVTIRGLGQFSVETTGTGAAGNLTIDTQRLNISDSASISASTSSPNRNGVGGNLTINATESFNLTNQASLLAQSNGAAKAGNVTINTEQLTANNGSITTSATATSRGLGGSIDVNASEINLKGTEIGLLAETQGVAPAGSLTLQPFNNGRNLTINLQDNAKISAATSGSGQGGSLRVTAPEAITIRGPGQLSVETTGAGAAGNLSIDTQKLTISDGATISASTSSKNPDGVGGNLSINATQSFNLTNQARLLAQSTGAAPAGNITIHTGQLTANNGSIETSATQSAGGGITITASDIRLFGDSDIRTDVASGAGGGGNINLTANSIIAFGDSDILAYAADGKGGDITFKTPIFFGFAYSPAPKGTDPDTLDHNNQVDINATGAVEGVISLPNLSFIQNSLTELPSNQIDTDSLLANSCIVRRNQPTRGSFTITGTGGLPQRPGDAQMSTFPTVDIETLPSDSTPTNTNPSRPWQKGDPIVEPQGVYRLPNGKLVMSRECSGIQ